MSRFIYADHAATTALSDTALRAMTPYFQQQYGNPSSLYRFAQEQGYDVTASADLSGYTDAGEISSYAVYALGWAVAEGIVNGTGGHTLAPQGGADRAQTAAMLMRFCQRYTDTQA